MISSAFQIKGSGDSSYVNMPEPKRGGIVVTDEPIWASNTGRSSTGKMIGDVVAWKSTIEVAWGPLSYEEAKTLRDKVRGAGDFFSIKYYDIENGTPNAQTGKIPYSTMSTTKTVYVGNIPRALLSLTNTNGRYEGITLKFVEQ